MITINRELIRGGVGTDILTACLKRHGEALPEMQRLRAYVQHSRQQQHQKEDDSAVTHQFLAT